ncbi:DUF3592 domain-containing protein [Hymenobacter endophyticus]|uniref:DUF3592 domain-containing protein n=1 Tax=Hymenobacter endophyticus TaxID=3076335 RepID=A0ABU3TFZ7_9BACT|nr:DUF3592 domain-containing protein [Hymenobacter endophyticus]MDU0370296.1 hypothetical protein [Hymenobacter endophyticus]
MTAPHSDTPGSPTVSSRFLLLWLLLVLLIFGGLTAGLYQQARQRRHGIARPALVVQNHQERSAHILTLRYSYSPDTLVARYTEQHRNQVKRLRPGDSTTVRFWPEAPRRVEVTPR